MLDCRLLLFFSLLVCALEQLEEPNIVLAEETQVFYLVFEVCDALDTHTECVTRILFAVYAAKFEHIGVYHTATQNFYPTGVLAEGATLTTADVTAYVHLGARLGEGEVRGAQAYLCIFSKHLLCKKQ